MCLMAIVDADCTSSSYSSDPRLDTFVDPRVVVRDLYLAKLRKQRMVKVKYICRKDELDILRGLDFLVGIYSAADMRFCNIMQKRASRILASSSRLAEATAHV